MEYILEYYLKELNCSVNSMFQLLKGVSQGVLMAQWLMCWTVTLY